MAESRSFIPPKYMSSEATAVWLRLTNLTSELWIAKFKRGAVMSLFLFQLNQKVKDKIWVALMLPAL